MKVDISLNKETKPLIIVVKVLLVLAKSCNFLKKIFRNTKKIENFLEFPFSLICDLSFSLQLDFFLSNTVNYMILSLNHFSFFKPIIGLFVFF